MRKYFQIFKLSLISEFSYRFNFILWRVRNVLQILVVFFFWNNVFGGQNEDLFGYNKEKILTYVFGVLVLRAIVLSARAVDVAGEISSGNLTNFLIKPLSYFKYWFTRDIASKTLNLGFSLLEIVLLYFLIKPPIYIQSDPLTILGFLISLFLATVLFFVILFLVNCVSFWMPENAWAAQFLFIGIILEFLAGGIFPLDVFPKPFFSFLSYLPFYYILFFPLQVYLGKIEYFLMIKGISVSLFWFVILSFLLSKTWKAGVKFYNAEGR